MFSGGVDFLQAVGGPYGRRRRAEREVAGLSKKVPSRICHFRALRVETSHG